MEFSILYNIPRTGFLDTIFLFCSKIAGQYGQLWVIIGIVLLIFKKTRKTGIAVLISYVGVLLLGELLLKHLVIRERPFEIDQAIKLLVVAPTSSSFPSTHSAFAFGAATAIFMNYRKAGIAVYVFAAMVAFSRMYLFLHFPTDVLCGIFLGIAMGIAGVKLSDLLMEKLKKA
jgi:undecaprenyl-diphosphatase